MTAIVAELAPDRLEDLCLESVAGFVAGLEYDEGGDDFTSEFVRATGDAGFGCSGMAKDGGFDLDCADAVCGRS